MRFLVVFVVLVLAFAGAVNAWDEDELEIFDLVEEVTEAANKQTFYEYLGVEASAGTAEIRKAYRKLSLTLHPDKSDAPDAALKFRLLAGIYEVLKDAKRREIYDRVLAEGLPDWRMPIYYIRRMRKMNLAEGVVYLVLIVTVCQYFVNWAAYWERKFTLKEQVRSTASTGELAAPLKPLRRTIDL